MIKHITNIIKNVDKYIILLPTGLKKV